MWNKSQTGSIMYTSLLTYIIYTVFNDRICAMLHYEEDVWPTIVQNPNILVYYFKQKPS